MAKMTGFVWQDEYLERLAKLSDQELGRLVRALSVYHSTGETQELAGRESIAFDFIKVDIDRIEQKYSAKCESNRNNRQRSSTNDNDRQRSSTIVNEQQRTVTKRDETPKDKDKVKDKEKYIKETVLTDSKEKVGASAPDRSLDRSFDKFWLIYPRKEGKQDARKAFAKIKPDDDLLNTMLEAVQKQKQSDQWSDPRYIPHPATWLNGKRWEDEPVKAQGKTKQVSAQAYDQRDYSEEELEEKLGLNDLFKGVAG